jgi:hypothetical protein
MTETEPSPVKTRGLWMTLFALATHAVLGFICLTELVAVPRLIRIFEDQDILLPQITIVVIMIYSAFRGVWYFLPLPAMGLLAADTCVFSFLFHHPRYRLLGIWWFFAVLLALLLFTTYLTAALFLPFLGPS